MKKLILITLLLCGIATAVAAQAYDPVPMANTPANQPENNAFFYNNIQNIYYTAPIYRSYWHWDNRLAQWVQRIELVAPYPTFINSGKPYQPVYPTATTSNNNNGGRVNNITKPGGQ